MDSKDNKALYAFTAVLVWGFICICILKFGFFYNKHGVVNTQMIKELSSSLSAEPLNSLCFDKRTMFFLLCATVFYICIIFTYVFNGKKYMRGTEHGSSKWARRNEINSVKDTKNFKNNIILTDTEGISLDCRVPGVNLNTLVIGGSGTGKTRFFLKPNLMQMNSSYVITDPKGEILRAEGKMLEDEGYKIKVLNLVDMERSSSYNPFAYLREGKDEDVMTLINTIMTNTQDKKSSSSDPFWEKAEMLFLQAIFFYLVYEAPERERNIPMVMELIRAADIKENQEDFKSDLDLLFEALEKEKGDGHIAVIQYKHFKVAAGKTSKSIVISAAARLAPYNIPAVANISLRDDFELAKIGEERTALFIIISPTNTTFNFIAAMLYTQLFAELDYIANWKYGGQLPIKTRFLLDEFANIGRIPEFEKILAYARSLGLCIAPIFQSLSQLKEMYKDNWETIVDNCSSFLFLGGQGQATTEYVSKLLGKTTIDTMTTSRSKGRNSSSNLNFNILGRELLMPNEIAKMPSSDCILFVKGLNPYKSKKYDIKKHPNYKRTEDSDKANTYIYKPQEKPELTEVEIQDLIKSSEYTIKNLELDEFFENLESGSIAFVEDAVALDTIS